MFILIGWSKGCFLLMRSGGWKVVMSIEELIFYGCVSLLYKFGLSNVSFFMRIIWYMFILIEKNDFIFFGKISGRFFYKNWSW